MHTPTTSASSIEETLRRGLGALTLDGSLVVETGKFTGRAVKERYVVKRSEVEGQIHWGAVNQPMEKSIAEKVEQGVRSKLESSESFHYEGYVGGFPIAVTSLSPWHIAFASNMFRAIPVASIAKKLQSANLPSKKIQIFHDPNGNLADYAIAGLPPGLSSTLILLDPVSLTVCIIGTAYAGEIKKSAFTLSNFVLPSLGILPMHASANVAHAENAQGESSVLFGLSGTGKTTLSASPDRSLIGDDEIVWTETGLSNLEGGCYAKLIDLKEANEPEIFRASNRFGAILENVGFDAETRKVDFFDRSKTENTRGSYPLEALGEVFPQDQEAKPPKALIFLTADAFGALPAVARLNAWQAQYHFMSGYTAKVAGTELGVKEPKAAFSCCFGAPFMPRPAQVYAQMLAEKVAATGSEVWLLNTGWVGGYEKGERFPIAVSRKLLSEIQSGSLGKAPMQKHPVFGFDVPLSCDGVESKWLALPSVEKAQKLAALFRENFEKSFSGADPRIAELGGPVSTS